jgi:hypothetical protein
VNYAALTPTVLIMENIVKADIVHQNRVLMLQSVLKLTFVNQTFVQLVTFKITNVKQE